MTSPVVVQQETIDVNSIYYKSTEIGLDSINKLKLDRIKEFLKDDSILEVLIVTYMDASESKDFKGLISTKRGVFLKKYLVEEGISEHRIYLEPMKFEYLNDSKSADVDEETSRRADFKFFKD
ncbi:hypothetical protein [uncultured Zobellia sp.]|uniref:hypothetical protein n=1 Tax=uncultured Zobellia sp. TaxID=255433 RepID=UPI002597F497|nr:hypothetical protein [uncultured Zobellia sp.]